MITLQRADPKVSAFLGSNKGLKDGDRTTPSVFAVAMHIGKRPVVTNMLTGQCIESKYFEWFESREKRILDENDAEMMALVKRDFLVSPGIDESDRYSKLIKMMRRLDRHKEGYTGYTILPTTACNARCSYCYQAGIAYETMTDEVVEQTIRYIHKTRRRKERVHLHWFGGEPLMGEKAIDRICASMRAEGVKYSSNMISNGSMMSEAMAEKAKNDWHLVRIQITLDGREQIYCDRKQYVNFKGSPYRAVLDGIHALLKRGIRVNIRLNADEENLNELTALVEELEVEFEGEGPMGIYCHSIFADKDGETDRSNAALYEGMKKLNERLYRFNRERGGQKPSQKSNDPNRRRKKYDRRFTTRKYYCMVDNPLGGPVIHPSGDLYLCEHIGELPVVGTIYDTGFVDREQFVERGREKLEKCAKCSLLPKCTDFAGCPAHDRNCYKERMEREINNLRNLEKEKRLPPITISHKDKIIRIVEPTAEFAESCTPILADDYLKADMVIKQDEAERLLQE